MSLMVSSRAGQAGRPAVLFAGDGELGVLAGEAEPLVAVGDVPGASAKTVLVQLVMLTAMMASIPARVHGTCIVITSAPSPRRDRGLAFTETPWVPIWLGLAPG
jgi:hypothetical protein